MRQKRPLAPLDFPLRTELLLDAEMPVAVLRAHVIAETIGTLCAHRVIDGPIQNDARNAIAVELNVPALWLEAAAARTIDEPTVSLDLLEEYREWRKRCLDAEVA